MAIAISHTNKKGKNLMATINPSNVNEIPNEGDLRLSFVPQAAFDYVRGLALETVTDVQGQTRIVNSQIQVLNDLEASQETQITLLRANFDNGFLPADVWFPYLQSKLEVQRDRLHLNQVIQVLSAWQTDFFNESTRTNAPKLKVLEAAIAELREEINKLKGVGVDQDKRLDNATPEAD
jgi:hypothetical protein